MELLAPITVNCITNEFPGHAIFRSRDHFSQPLLHSEELNPGEIYHLLPLNPYSYSYTYNYNAKEQNGSVLTPYRMSCAEAEVFPRYNNISSGVWKVKLVISPDHLSEILSHQARTQELIESVRTVAKCATGASSLASSDHLSVSSSCKGSSQK